MSEPSPLELAIRAYPELEGKTSRPRAHQPWHRPIAMVVFDTETRTDATQSLLFGCFRYIVGGQCVREALFHARDLSREPLKNGEL